MARYTLHGMWPSGPTYRVGLMLALAGEAFDYVHVNLLQGEHKSPDYVAKNRYGVVPSLTDNAMGQTFTQSSAIIQLVAEQTGKLNGETPAERLLAREWVFWAADRLSRGVYRTRAIKHGFMKAGPDVAAHYEAEAKAALTDLDGWLGHRAWIAGGGAPTFGDIDLYAIVHYAGEAGVNLADHDNLARWTARLEALPGFAPPETLLPKASRAA